MAFNAKVIKVLIASPSDVGEERKMLTEVVNLWNVVNSEHYRCVLLPIKWETNASPEMGGRPQEILNKQFVTDCDILVGVFWTRMGTHTGIAESGTAEEIEQLRSQGKPVMLYFSSAKIDPDALDFEQYDKLKQYKTKLKNEGYLETYSDISDLKEKINRHLTSRVRDVFTSGISNEKTLSIDIVNNKWMTLRDSPVLNVEGKVVLKELYEFIINNKFSDVDDGDFFKLADSLKSMIDSNIESANKDSMGKFWILGKCLIDDVKELIL
ncbi:hypothetical protein [Paenibacillus odorifer]|uniref:hypothetical protein n=1 Tax=Paenibacillus odorifer TaxID=189426 RepID=UPI000B9FF32C|nr:hypothetical protein [Paenibacillus odorifer]OZQ68300.1 hypothetical protein CA596_25870 [Paenibacillus odorifer]